MPAVSGSPTQPSTSVASRAELSTVPTGQFQTGDLAAIRQSGDALPIYFTLQKESHEVVDGINVLYTANSNPADVGPGQPGRWIVFPGGGGGGGGGVIIWCPGGAPLPGVYPTWPEAYAAASLGATIFIDQSIAPAIIPAGTYDMSGLTLESALEINAGGPNPVVLLADGVKFRFTIDKGGLRVRGLTVLQSQSNSAIIDQAFSFGGEVPILFLSEGSALYGSANAPFIDIPPNGNVIVVVMELGGQLGEGSNVAVHVGNQSALLAILFQTASIQSGALSGAATANAQIQIDDSSNLNLPQALFAGQLNINVVCQSSQEGFNPGGEDALWNDPTFTFSPGTYGPVVQEALTNLIRRQAFFTYRPAESNPSGVVFNNWNTLMNAISGLVSGVDVTIEFDATGEAVDIPLPPGFYNLPANITLQGNTAFGSSPTQVRFGDGTNAGNDAGFLLSPGTRIRNLSLLNNNISASALLCGNSSLTYLLQLEGIGALLDAGLIAGGPALIDMQTGQSSVIQIEGEWNLFGSTNRPVIRQGNFPAFLRLRLSEHVNVGPNSLQAVGSGLIDLDIDGNTSVSFQQSPPIVWPLPPIVPSPAIDYFVDGTDAFSIVGPIPAATPIPVAHNLGTKTPFFVLFDDTGASQPVTCQVVDENNCNLFSTNPIGAVTWSGAVRR